MTHADSPGVAVGPARQRIDAIDACRGFALLGIFMVNIALFSGPMGDMLSGEPPAAALGLWEQIAWYVTGIFFAGKFYPLFSLLFGAGLILQMERIEKVGGRFVPLYLRRLGFLLLIGMLHATLLWYGDILFVYAIAGTALLLLRKLRPRAMLMVAAGLYILTLLLAAGGAAMSTMQTGAMARPEAETASPGPVSPGPSEANPAEANPTEPDPAEATPAGSEGTAGAATPPTTPPTATPTTPPPSASSEDASAPAAHAEHSPEVPTPAPAAVDPAKRPLYRLFDAMQSPTFKGPADPAWSAAERDAYGQGGFVPAMIMRVITWAGMLVFCLLGFGWHVPMMFLVGAALLKMGIFRAENIRWHRWFLAIGLAAGMPIAVVSACSSTLFPDGAVRAFVMAAGMYTAGPLVALAYIAAITLLVHHGKAQPITQALARVGRMALTNYLMQTVLATSIFYWYGLGLFDQVSGLGCMGIVVVIYLAQVAFSTFWMTFFLYGPMEWLWRSVTYLKVQPLLRSSADQGEGA